MKLVAKFEDGREVELKEIKGLQDGDVLVGIATCPIREQDLEKMSQNISKRLGKKFVLLSGTISKLYSV